jgi:predicted nucleic acid-binding protein
LTLVDTNVLLDLLTNDPVWVDWSDDALSSAALNGAVFINDVVYAELSARFDSVEPLDEFIRETNLEILSMPRPALFLASKVYQRYRRAGGTRTGVLSDFFLGAQAAVLNIPILTRDIGRYRTYFPDIVLIAPKMA